MNRAANSKDVEHKTTKKTNQESALTSKKADLEGTQKELDAALAYYDKLKPSRMDRVELESQCDRSTKTFQDPSRSPLTLPARHTPSTLQRIPKLDFEPRCC